MKTALVFLVLTVCTHQVFSITSYITSIFGREKADWEKPDFCKDYDCPRFTILETTDDYELRQYETSHWVMTEMEREDELWEDRSKMGQTFMKLFRYIDGANEKQMKMPMTVPVLMTHKRNQVMMGFMIPANVGASAPKPTDESLMLVTRQPSQIYVRSFSGWAYGFFNNKNYYKSELAKLKAALQRDGKSVVSIGFGTAGYDSPWTFFNRHNEVAITKA